MSEQITVTVDVDGNVTVGANGVKGSGCQALTREIEQAIGKTSADQKTPEFFQGAGQACQLPQQAKAGQ